ncbi:unnamed protein product, partial [Didymodactylos carnosus]
MNELQNPLDLALDSQQSLYVADYVNHHYVSNVFIDKSDNLYFTLFAEVKKLNMTSGLITRVASNDGNAGSALNQL